MTDAQGPDTPSPARHGSTFDVLTPGPEESRRAFLARCLRFAEDQGTLGTVAVCVIVDRPDLPFEIGNAEPVEAALRRGLC